MLQEASTDVITPESSEDFIASESWSIETYADGLMDDLFADVDSVMDGTGIPSSTIAPPTIQSGLQTQFLTIPKNNNKVTQVVSNTDGVGKTVKKRRRKSKRSFGKLFSGVATIGLAVAAVVWVLNSGLSNLFGSKSFSQVSQQPQKSLSQSETGAEVGANLANYMLQALTIMDRKEVTQDNSKYASNIYAIGDSTRTAFSYLSNSPSNNLPTPLAANNIPPMPGHVGTVVQRIYIPVYQAPSPMRPPGSISGVLPSLTKYSTFKTAFNNMGKTVKPVGENLLSLMRPDFFKAPTVQAKPIIVPQPPKPVVSAIIPPPPKQEVALQIPSVTYRLQGVLDLGDPSRSAALFEIGNVTRRVQVGESIGSSDWTLVNVTKTEAIIRRNGEVRSIYAGQEF